MPLSTLAASTVAVVWITIGLLTTVAMIVMIVALVRHAMLVGRAAGRMSDEVGALTAEISARAPRDPGTTPGARRGRGR